jgi:hypothetical protein
LVQEGQGFSGAELEQVVISALYDAFYAGGELTTEGLLTALQETVPLSKTMQEDIDRLRAWAGTRARRATPVAEAEMAEESLKRRIEF